MKGLDKNLNREEQEPMVVDFQDIDFGRRVHKGLDMVADMVVA